MKNMKTIIALLLGATGAAAFTTGVKAATVGLGSFATASYPALSEEIVAPAAMTAFPVKDAPGRRLADRCEDWCSDPSSGGGQPWNVRCGWDDKACSGCDECNSCSATGCCFDWCADHSEPWNVRCGWDDKACSGCAQCNSCSDIGCCFGWCAGESAPWNERCGWDTDDCSACAECCAAPKYVKDDLCRACPSGHTCDGTVMTKCDAPKYVLNNECTACPSGHTCDGTNVWSGYKCATNTYVLNNECTACPSGHTCDGTTATKVNAAERAECLAGSDGSCGKCCEGITGVCVTESKYLDTLTDEDDCVLLRGKYLNINRGVYNKKIEATSPRLKRPWLFLASARRVGKRRRRRDRRRGGRERTPRQRLPRPSGIPTRRRLVHARAARRSRRRFAHA